LAREKLKTALVTGAAKRIGASIVRDLVEHDYAVAIHAGSSIADAEKLAADIRQRGGRAVAIGGNLLDSGETLDIVAKAAAALGPLDLVVNNASIFIDDSLDSFSDEVWDNHFTIHAKAPSLIIRQFARQLPEGVEGLAVNIIDQRVWAPNPRFYSYTLSKAALWMATCTMAQALAPAIRVNAIGPGPTLPSPRQTRSDFDAQVEALILKRGPSLGDFGKTIRYLHDMPSITGQMIALDGGQHLSWQTPDVAEINE
jgi:NAD(P)-dependent dehydrogenase (short-subunit alcohol dehydrogenase family)